MNSEEQLRLVVDASLDIIYSYDLNGRFTSANKTFCLAMNMTEKQILGRTHKELGFPEEQCSEWQSLHERVYATNARVISPTSSVMPDGKIHHFEVVLNPLHDSDGTIIGIGGTTRDFTERMNSERALHDLNEEITRNNDRLERLVRLTHYRAESIQELLEYALEEAIELTKSKIGYIFHYSEKESLFTLNTWSKNVTRDCTVVEPQTVYELSKTGCWGEVVRQRKFYLTNHYHQDMEFAMGIPEGHIQLNRFLSVPIFDRDEIVAVIGVANKDDDYTQTDVHQLALLMDNTWKVVDREKALQELKMAKERAERSDKLKSVFLANMSHEIRSPMNAIVGFADVLVDPGLGQDDRKRFSSIIQSKSKELARLINDLMDLSRIETGNTTVIPETVNFNDLIDELESVFRQKIQMLERTDLAISSEKPLSGTMSRMITDKYLVNQVFSNLLDNAVKYTPSGSIRFGYQLPAQGMLTCFVSDSGVGIAPEDHEVIFDNFRQGDTGNGNRYGGIGLGLAICKGVIGLLGGTINVESMRGQGSNFVFTVPFQPPRQTDGQNTKAATSPYTQINKYSWNGKQILVVEDEIANMEFLKVVLGKTGVRLIMAFDGDQTRSHYKELSGIDLVLLDIRLPDVAGYELAREIKEIRPDLPLIAQTAYAMTGDKQKCMEAGCDQYITKPIDRDLLLKTIDELLRGITG
jgi:PAS domain S-box-containing protein